MYYHRLDKDILFKALLNYVEPKIRREEARLDELRSQKISLGPAAKGGQEARQGHRSPGSVPLRTPGFRGQAPQGGEPSPRPRPQRRRGPQHRPAPGTRPLEGGQVLLGRPHEGRVRVVVHRQAITEKVHGPWSVDQKRTWDRQRYHNIIRPSTSDYGPS